MTKIRVLLADDHSLFREGLASILNAQPDFEVVGEASDGQEAIERYRQVRPDAVTLDLVMPEHDGLHALRGIIDFDPEAKVVMVSALEQRGVLKDAFKAGAVPVARDLAAQHAQMIQIALALTKVEPCHLHPATNPIPERRALHVPGIYGMSFEILTGYIDVAFGYVRHQVAQHMGNGGSCGRQVAMLGVRIGVTISHEVLNSIRHSFSEAARIPGQFLLRDELTPSSRVEFKN